MLLVKKSEEHVITVGWPCSASDFWHHSSTHTCSTLSKSNQGKWAAGLKTDQLCFPCIFSCSASPRYQDSQVTGLPAGSTEHCVAGTDELLPISLAGYQKCPFPKKKLNHFLPLLPPPPSLPYLTAHTKYIRRSVIAPSSNSMRGCQWLPRGEG